MSFLEPMRRGAEELFETLGEGWEWLRRRASAALTRFHPTEADAAEVGRAGSAIRWGLLAGSIAETDDEVVVELEAPGMEAEDFSIRVEHDALIVGGHKRVDREERRGRYHLVEMAYGRFERRLPLPCEVAAEEARARYERGVLTVRLPRAEHTRRRQVTVRGA